MDPNIQPPANAEPSKAFFIEMLTRDLTLSDCILDLIDNSIHTLISESNLDVSDHLFTGTKAQKVKALIEITFTAAKFQIKDDSVTLIRVTLRHGLCSTVVERTLRSDRIRPLLLFQSTESRLQRFDSIALAE